MRRGWIQYPSRRGWLHANSGNYVPFFTWIRLWFRDRKREDCSAGGKHNPEVAHGGDFCLKCGKVNPDA